jgi:uncharacterized protein YutE (UPF0331/DUF86 family)
MVLNQISRQIVVDRLDWVQHKLAQIHTPPLDDPRAFFADWRNPGAADASLRQALEALFDLGRHILFKGFGVGVSEYHEIAVRLQDAQVLTSADAPLLASLAGVRNHLVHFYQETSEEGLYEICCTRLGDVEGLARLLQEWLRAHPERMDSPL